MDTKLIVAESEVAHARAMMSYGQQGLEGFPNALMRIIKHEYWRARFIEQTGMHVTYEANEFERFVTDPLPAGMATSIDYLKQIVAHRPDVLDAIDRLVQRPNGGDRKSEEFKISVSNINTDTRPAGTTTTYALRKLRKDRPDLHKLVLTEEMTAHAAMIEAGYRQRTATIYPDDIERTARALKRHFDRDQLEELFKLCAS